MAIKNTPENMRPLTVMLPHDVIELMIEKAEEDNLSRSDIFRRLIAKAILSEYKLRLKNNKLTPVSP